jgi:hypothetical protein
MVPAKSDLSKFTRPLPSDTELPNPFTGSSGSTVLLSATASNAEVEEYKPVGELIEFLGW